MSCNIEEIRSKFINKIGDKLKTTKNIKVYPDNVVITWDGKYIKSKDAAFKIAQQKVDEINALGKEIFKEEFGPQTYAKLDGENSGFVRFRYGLPYVIKEAYRLKTETSTPEAFLKNTSYQNTDFYNGDDALREQEERDQIDEDYMDLYPETLELDQDDKEVLNLYNILSKELRELNGTPATKEEIEQALFKYNEMEGKEKYNIPDLTSRTVLNKIKQIRQDFILISDQAETAEYKKRTDKKDREAYNYFGNYKELKTYSGTFKPLLNRVAKLIEETEDQLAKVRLNLDQAKRDKNESRTKELLKRVGELNNTVDLLQSNFDHLVKQRSLEPMIYVAQQAIIDISNAMNRTFINSTEHVDTMYAMGQLIDYWDSVLNDKTGTYISTVEQQQFRMLTNKRIFIGDDKLELSKQESDNGYNLLEALEILKNKRDVLREKYLQQVADEKLGSNIYKTIENVADKIEDKQLKKDVSSQATKIIMEKASNEGKLSPEFRKDLNFFIVEIKDKTALSKEDKERAVEFLTTLANNSDSYVNILETIRDASFIKYWTHDISRQDRVADQVLAKLIQGTEVKKDVKTQELINKANTAFDNLLKKYSLKEIKDILFRKTESGLNSQAIRSKYTEKHGLEYSKMREIFNQIYSIDKDIKLNTFEKIERKKKLIEDFANYLANSRSSIDLNILFSDLFKDVNFPYTSLETHTQAEKDAHIAKLKEELGEEEFNELYKKQEESIKQYLFFRETSLESLEEFIIHSDAIFDKGLLEAKYTNIREESGKIYGIRKTTYDKFIIDDIRENPLVYSNFVKSKKTIEYKGMPIFSSAKYYESVPKKYRDGKETGYYDPAYDKIKNDPDLNTFHTIMLDTAKQIEQLSGKKNQHGEHLITLLEKGMFETLFETRVGGKPLDVLKNALKSMFSIKSLIQENYNSISRVYGVKADTYDRTILELNSKYDAANKEQVDRIFQIEKEQIKIQLIDEGYEGKDLQKELENRTLDLRERIVHKLIEESVQDPKLTLNAMILHAQNLKFKSDILPWIRLYDQGLKQISSGYRSRIIDVNDYGEVKRDEKGKVKTKDSTKSLEIYKTFIKTFLGESTRKPLYGDATKVVAKLESQSKTESFVRTKEENEEIESLRKLYKNYQRLEKEGKITPEQLDVEKAKIEAELAKYTMYIGSTVDRIINSSNYYVVAKALFWSQLGPLINRLGGYFFNLSRSGRDYSLSSFNKASKILWKSPQTTSLIGGTIAGITIPLAIGTAPLALLAGIGVGTGYLGYNLGKKVGEFFSNRDPRIQKVINIASALGVFKWGDLISNPDSLQASIDRKLEGLKPMTYLKNAEFTNAVEQMLAFLIEMKVTVMDGEVKKIVGWEQLFNNDGTITTYDSYIVPWMPSPISKDTFIEELGGIKFMIAQSTGQYDSNFPIELTRTSLGRMVTTFNKWKIADSANLLESDEIKYYTIPDVLNNKNYKSRKGVITTLRQTYGTKTGVSVASILSGSAAYVAAGAASTAAMLSLVIPVTAAVAVGGYGLYNHYKGYKLGKKDESSPDFLLTLKRLSSIVPIISFFQKYKLENSSDSVFSSVSQADIDNLRQIKNIGNIVFIAFAATELLRYFAGDDKDEDKLLALLDYIARQTSSNVTGALSIDGLARDVKGGYGYNNLVSSLVDVGTTIRDFYYLLGYYGGMDELETKAIYQRDINYKIGKDVEAGETTRFSKDIEKLVPGLNKWNQVQEDLK